MSVCYKVPHLIIYAKHNLFSIVLYEFMARFCFPLCSALPHPSNSTPISCTTSIIDLGGVSLTAMWRLRNHLQDASRLATANYPETLGAIAVVNAPSFFPTVWGWIKVRSQGSASWRNILSLALRVGSTKGPATR